MHLCDVAQWAHLQGGGSKGLQLYTVCNTVVQLLYNKKFKKRGGGHSSFLLSIYDEVPKNLGGHMRKIHVYIWIWVHRIN